MSSSAWALIGALILCLGLSAFFSASETAFSALNHVKLKTLAADGNRKASAALRLSDDYDKLLTTILIGNNLVNIASSAMATILFTGLAGSMGATLSTITMTLLILIFGEVSPKTLAKEHAEQVAMAVTPALNTLVFILGPLDAFFAILRSGLTRIFRPSDDEGDIEDELMTMVDEAQTEGDMEAHEGELIRSAIEFNDQIVTSILTPRVDITAISDEATVEETEELFRESSYSRLPVYHEDLDHIVGILNEKDFYASRHAGCTDIRKIMSTPVFAPASIQISILLKLFQGKKTHMVILLDDFGGTRGLATLQDVMEELVGEIYDEHDDVSIKMKGIEPDCWSVDGSMQLEELLHLLNREGNYQSRTVGGWASEILKHIPSVGDTFTENSIEYTVTEMNRLRVTRAKIRKLRDPENDPKSDEPDN